MKTIQIHPMSALLGAGLLALVSFAAQRSVTPLGSFHGPPVPVEITAMPEIGGQYPGYDPRNAVVIREEAGPYTVPAGKRLVLTALGTPAVDNGSGVVLRINGTNEVSAAFYVGTAALTVQALPTGLTAVSLSTVEVFGTPVNDRAWGYLIDD